MKKAVKISFYLLSVFFLGIFFTSCDDSGVIPTPAANGQWVKNHGGANSDIMTSMQITSDGGSILTGYTISFSFGNNDIFLTKLDASGNITWNNVFGGSGNDQGKCVIQTSDGGYLVAGQTKSFGALNFDAYVLKLGAGGNIIWSSIYKKPNDQVVSGAVEMSGGGYIITGSDSTGGVNNYDIFALRIDANGSVQWAKTYGGTQNDFSASVKNTSTGGFIIAGNSYSFAPTSDVFVLNLSSNGSTVWTRTYGGEGEDAGSCIEQSGTDFIVCGYAQSFALTSEDMFILKMDLNGFLYHDANGNPRTFGGPLLQSDRANWIIPTADGGFIACGYMTIGTSNQDMVLVKLFGNLEFAWARRYGGSINDAGCTVKQKNDGYLAGGTTYSFGTGSSDIYLQSVKSDGSTCDSTNSQSFTPLGGTPGVTEGAVTILINDVTGSFQKNDVSSMSSGAGFSTITNCEIQ
jgi:hypothetical protein